MSDATFGQRSNIKKIIEESFRPDTTWRDNSVMVHINPTVSTMPIEPIIADLHTYMAKLREKNNFEHANEYYWLITHYGLGVSWETIAEWFGHKPHVVRDRVVDFEDIAINEMPDWLADKCLAIYARFYCEGAKPMPPSRKGIARLSNSAGRILTSLLTMGRIRN